MTEVRGELPGKVIKAYQKGFWELTYFKSHGYHCVTLREGRKPAKSWYSKDKKEIDEFIEEKINEGFEKSTKYSI